MPSAIYLDEYELFIKNELVSVRESLKLILIECYLLIINEVFIRYARVGGGLGLEAAHQDEHERDTHISVRRLSFSQSVMISLSFLGFFFYIQAFFSLSIINYICK